LSITPFRILGLPLKFRRIACALNHQLCFNRNNQPAFPHPSQRHLRNRTRTVYTGHMITRRTAMSLLPFALAAGPALAADTPPLAIVMNSAGASVSVINMNTKQVVETLPCYREPSHWALSPDRSKLYVADASGNALFIFDPITAAPLGNLRIPDPYQLGFSPDQKYLVINSLRLDIVEIYDGATLKLVKRFHPGKMPSHLDFSPDSRWSFNSMQDSNTLVSFDLTNMTIRWTAKVGATPAGVLWHNDKVLVATMGEKGITEIDPITGAVLRRIRTGEGAHNIFLSDDRTALYVSNRIAGTLTLLDPTTLEVKRNYRLPGGPDDMGIAPDGKLWVAMRFAETIAVVDPVTGHYDSIPVGRSPHGIFLNTELTKKGKLTAEVL
jgi:DNA-binding beta-propeller fold protein YncE